MKYLTMRDAFFNRLYEMAKSDKDIVVVTADLGAPTLDKFRRDFPRQFINVGISEQNAILVAVGLALRHKKPIAYAITQFITLRCYEQIRIYPCGMDLPVTILGVGAGVCYSESGPTHHSIEDLSVMRPLPNLKIYNPSDAYLSSQLAELAVDGNGPKFIRLDRDRFPNLTHIRNLTSGFSVLGNISDINILATGNMVHVAKEVSKKLAGTHKSIGVIDVFSIPLDEENFLRKIKLSKQLITLEEHSLKGGFSSYILEVLNDANIQIPVKRIGFDTSLGYKACYNYGGREAIRESFGMGVQNIISMISSYY